MSATLAKFYPDLVDKQLETKRKSVYLWEKQREHIENQCADTSSAAARRIRPLGTAPVLPAQAEDVVLWVRALRDEDVPVSAFMLQTRVLDVPDALKIPRSILSAEYNFRRGFILRHALSFRRNTRQGQIAPPDAMAIAAEFKKKVRARMADLRVDRVFNADQTAVFFEYVPKTTLSAKGSKTVWVRSGVPPYIVAEVSPSKVPATNEDNIRLRQGFGIHIWREVKELQRHNKVVMHGNTRGWWNEGLSVAFLEHHFGDRANMATPVLLMWDDLSADWTPTVQECADRLKVELIKVPPGCTAVCQPADINWNGPLKARLRVRWVENVRQQLKAPREEEVKFKLVAPKRKDVANL